MDLAGLEVELRGLQAKALRDIAATDAVATLDELGSSLLGKRGAITGLSSAKLSVVFFQLASMEPTRMRSN